MAETYVPRGGRLIFTLLLINLLTYSCSNQSLHDRLWHEPSAYTAHDSVYADVYRALDGIWQGRFSIYEDPLGQRTGIAKPKAFSAQWIRSLKLMSTVEVRQQYESVSAFFQNVIITDVYTGPDGQPSTITSRGVNTVRDGNLWCVVKKPEDLVMHHGVLIGDTLVWAREETSPLRVERFHEFVSDDRYTISGWGYYGNDDPSLTPRTWFYAEYKRGPQPDSP